MSDSSNTIDRRANLLADALRDRVDSAFHSLTEPVPAFRVAKPPDIQIREYLALKNSGQLPSLRESMGGPYPDDQVDRYATAMERLAPKHLPSIMGLPPVEPEF